MGASGGRLGARGRVVLVAVALALIAPLVAARRLRPDPRGFGTHEQLGLKPCGFRAATGRPCPTCGVTTALAWAVRGRLDRAWRANPAGGLLGPALAGLAAWLVAGAAAGRPWKARSWDFVPMIVVVATGAVGLAAWLIRLLV